MSKVKRTIIGDWDKLAKEKEARRSYRERILAAKKIDDIADILLYLLERVG